MTTGKLKPPVKPVLVINVFVLLQCDTSTASHESDSNILLQGPRGQPTTSLVPIYKSGTQPILGGRGGGLLSTLVCRSVQLIPTYIHVLGPRGRSTVYAQSLGPAHQDQNRYRCITVSSSAAVEACMYHTSRDIGRCEHCRTSHVQASIVTAPDVAAVYIHGTVRRSGTAPGGASDCWNPSYLANEIHVK